VSRERLSVDAMEAPMEAKLRQQSELNVALASQLACPACHGDLRADAAALVCAGCGRGYPVVDGIPVLIAERAALDESRDNQQG
jgi:uncharacterized protein